MKRPWMLFACAVVVLGAVMVWQLRGVKRSPPPAARGADVESAAARPPSPPSSLPAARPPEAPKLTVAAEPSDPEAVHTKAPHDLEVELNLARVNLTHAAHDCYGVASRLDPAQTLRVRMTLGIGNGDGRVEKPTILDGTVADETVRECVLKAFRAARWRTTSPDRELMFESEYTVEELIH